MTDKIEKNNESDQVIRNGSGDPFLRDGIGSFPERLEQVIGGQSVRQFAHEIGLSEGAVRAFKQGRIPRADDALAIARHGGVDLMWLLSGEEPKQPGLVMALGKEAGVKEDPHARYSDKDAFDEEYALVDGYHVTVSAGHGAFNGENTPVMRRLAFRRKWLKYRGFKPEQLKVVFAKGDSMEPTIDNGDSLLINLAASKPIDGQIFVVRLGEELYAKRIQKRWDGAIELISDNKEYEKQVIPASELSHLAIIGQVVWLGKDLGR